MKTSIKKLPAILKHGALVAAAIALLPACGKQAFQKTDVSLPLGSAGSFSIPPKIDIVVFQDDTGSMMEVLPQIQAQMPSFLQTLNSTGWDYRFAIHPLTSSRTMSPGAFQIAASQQDLNWKNEVEGWSPPYPGMSESLADQVMGGFFARPFGSGLAPTFSNFLSDFEARQNNTGSELGLKNIAEQLTQSNRLRSTGFIRNDAMLLVLAISNGEDSEGRCPNPSNPSLTIPCPDTVNGVYQPNGYNNTFNQRYQQILSAKGSSSKVKFAAAVADARYSNCLGSSSYTGSRYMAMAGNFGGLKYNICNTGIATVLDNLKSSLQSERRTYRQNYLFIPEEPVPESIQVVKYINGDPNNAVTIPQSDTNGWSYVGYTTQYAIFYPTQMNQQTGWAIRLNGSAILDGDDRADVIYTTP